MVALSSFSYLQTLPSTPSLPHEFLNKSISRILFISASCTAIILLLWLHPLCHLSPRVPFTGQHQIFIASLFFNNLSTSISQPFPLCRLFPFTGEKRPFRDSLFWLFLVLVLPNFVLAVPFLSLSVDTLTSTLPLRIHCIVILSNPLCLPPSSSILTSVPCLSASHAFVSNPPPPPLCMLKYSVKEGSRGGSGGERVVGRGGISGGGNIDVKSAAVVMIFCSLFLGTSGPLEATISSTVFTGS